VVLLPGTRFQPPGNIHAPYYPLKGPYSSSDPATIRTHMQELLACNVTVLVRDELICVGSKARHARWGWACTLHAAPINHPLHCPAPATASPPSPGPPQVISWWGPSWREGTHDTQGVNTDAVLGIVLRELEQQDQLKLAFHLEPYEGISSRGLMG
jgi:glycoprotein endo-alpha-1,2-mannosidase